MKLHVVGQMIAFNLSHDLGRRHNGGSGQHDFPHQGMRWGG